MTYTPPSLLDARAYVQRHTGLPWVSLGIVGSSGHHAAGTSYHIGWSHLETWAYSRQHPRDTKLRTEAASALDIGQWSEAGLVALTAFLVAEARAGRLPDVRAIIGPAADGRAYRWDRHDSWTPRQRARGDSHETHLHISYYRDSEHRSKMEPFRTFFEEDAMPTANEIADAVLSRRFRDYLTGESSTVAHQVYSARRDAAGALTQVGELAGQVAGLAELVRQLAGSDSTPLTPEQLAELTAAVEAAARAPGERIAAALAQAGQELADLAEKDPA